MKKPEVFITGANGEIGQRLIEHLAEEGIYDIVALDLREPTADLSAKCKAFYRGNILDKTLIESIETGHCFEVIYHLAGLLSSTGEKNPKLAHDVNVDGSIAIMQVAQNHSILRDEPTVFVFSSSIAAYGFREDDDKLTPVHERQYLTPKTMYGINKLYIEQLGRYYNRYYRAEDETKYVKLDFRCVRFPGLISPDTVPTGGTSDYGPEMLHAAAKGEPYACFVSAETVLPFMVMSDAVRSLILLSRADRDDLNHHIYNVTSFSVTAEQIRQKVMAAFPEAEVSYDPAPLRQGIVDSWPAVLDDRKARRDWGWAPEYDFDRAFDEVLIPRVKATYSN